MLPGFMPPGIPVEGAQGAFCGGVFYLRFERAG
jgi:hypothetical protein